MVTMPAEQQTDVTYVLSDLNNRVRTLESKYMLFGERLLIVNKNMIEEYKKMVQEIRLINADLREIKQESERARDVIHSMLREMEFFAKRDQVKVLEKYIKLWDPLSFVTEDQLQNMLNDQLKAKKVVKGETNRGRPRAPNR